MQQCGKNSLARNDHETCQHAAKVRRTGLCTGSQPGSSAPGEQGQEIKKTSILDVKQVNKRKVAFFLSETSVFSGASRATRKLLIPKTELLQRFYSRYPKLLRGKAAENPGLLEADRHKKHFT